MGTQIRIYSGITYYRDVYKHVGKNLRLPIEMLVQMQIWMCHCEGLLKDSDCVQGRMQGCISVSPTV